MSRLTEADIVQMRTVSSLWQRVLTHVEQMVADLNDRPMPSVIPASFHADDEEEEQEEYPLVYIVRRDDFSFRSIEGGWSKFRTISGLLFTPEEAADLLPRLNEVADIVSDKRGAVQAHITKLLNDRLSEPPIPGTIGSIRAGLEPMPTRESLAAAEAARNAKLMYFPSDTTLAYGRGVLHGATGQKKEIIFSENDRRAYNSGYAYGEAEKVKV